MQICSALCTLNIWQVKTICPVNPSDAEGEGMDACADAGSAVGIAVEKLKSGVAIGSTGAGDEDENESGVDACKVANKSGVRVDAAGRLHPANTIKRMNASDGLILFMIRFD